jgi:hypothetical protein
VRDAPRGARELVARIPDGAERAIVEPAGVVVRVRGVAEPVVREGLPADALVEADVRAGRGPPRIALSVVLGVEGAGPGVVATGDPSGRKVVREVCNVQLGAPLSGADVPTLPRFRHQTVDIPVNESAPQLEYALFAYGDHMARSTILTAKMLKNNSSIAMSRHAPASVIVDNGYITVLSIGGQQFVIQIRERVEARILFP